MANNNPNREQVAVSPAQEQEYSRVVNSIAKKTGASSEAIRRSISRMAAELVQKAKKR
jgi:hypothetical protein